MPVVVACGRRPPSPPRTTLTSQNAPIIQYTPTGPEKSRPDRPDSESICLIGWRPGSQGTGSRYCHGMIVERVRATGQETTIKRPHGPPRERADREMAASAHALHAARVHLTEAYDSSGVAHLVLELSSRRHPQPFRLLSHCGTPGQNGGNPRPLSGRSG